jgi:hypothetical protein
MFTLLWHRLFPFLSAAHFLAIVEVFGQTALTHILAFFMVVKIFAFIEKQAVFGFMLHKLGSSSLRFIDKGVDSCIREGNFIPLHIDLPLFGLHRIQILQPA